MFHPFCVAIAWPRARESAAMAKAAPAFRSGLAQSCYDDHAVEGKVVSFSGAPPAPVRPQRGQPGEWRPVIPEHLRTRQGIRKAAAWNSRRARHHALYHGARLPVRVVATVRWAAAGAAQIVFAQLGWWWISEQAYLRHDAVASGDTQKWLSLYHRHRPGRRRAADHRDPSCGRSARSASPR